MSDLAMYEALASAMLARHGKSADRLRRAEAQMLLQRDSSVSPEHREGISLVLGKLRERIRQIDLPLGEGSNATSQEPRG